MSSEMSGPSHGDFFSRSTSEDEDDDTKSLKVDLRPVPKDDDTRKFLLSNGSTDLPTSRKMY